MHLTNPAPLRPRHASRALWLLAALVAAAVFALASPSEAAANPPFSAYGTGLPAGATVEAKIGGVKCGETLADAQGTWLLQIAPDAPCSPKAGSTIVFYVNGAKARETASWSAGGAPADPAYGIKLTVGSESPKPAPEPSSSDKWAGGKAPSSKGVHLAVWGGGTIEEASSTVPKAVSFFVSVDGEIIAYVVGAPPFVNGKFFAKFSGGALGPNTAMIVVVGG